ncbi:MAG: 16S rRNA (cytidine(1402)-2'-O)-methyltransferase [Nitrospirae bacterium]|nr:16S rRNA (cytidine(1402)-2'-O)-methyltransferase [Nitrospirota bacterium]
MAENTPPQPGILYVVATPIGNLEDITLRAIRILGEADFILAEDTRTTRALLSHHAIHRPLVSLHAHNESRRARQVLEWLGEGRRLALVSEAGTPGVSDPGATIVSAVLDAGLPVSPVPGASALTAAVSVSGFPTLPIVFGGFFPRKPGHQRRICERMRRDSGTYVFFESPYRVKDTLDALSAQTPDATVCLIREATKVHETILQGRPADLAARLSEGEPRGEFVLILHRPRRPARPE